MFTLEPYKSLRSSRHICPSCGKSNVFVRYINESGEYLSETVGRCNRENKCGYHYPPREFFADNPEKSSNFRVQISKLKPAPIVAREKTQTAVTSKPINFFHTKEHLLNSLARRDSNSFYRFLLNLFPRVQQSVKNVCNDYYLGYFNNLTCFWQIDIRGRICRGKLIRYREETGKRQPVFEFKDKGGKMIKIPITWVHKVLQKKAEIPANLNLRYPLFGEHLLRRDPLGRRFVAIVEAEKTAIICAIRNPRFIWLATGAKSHLTPERLRVLKNRQVILYPDADAYGEWKEKEFEIAAKINCNIRTSAVLELTASTEEKAAGLDLADYIIRGVKEDEKI